MEEYIMTDKQYDGMLKSCIASFDRIAKVTTDKTVLQAIWAERKLAESQLGYEIPSNNLYNLIESE